MSTLAQLKQVANTTTTSAGKDLNKHLCFLLGEKTYAVNILKVKEIIEHTEITPIPMMPDFVWGAINLRGMVVPVIDLSRRLEMPVTELKKRTCFVIVEVNISEEQMDVGFVVDAVSKVADIPFEDRAPPPTFGGNIKNEYVLGIGKIGDEFVLLLNIDKVLSMDDIETIRGMANLSVDSENNGSTGDHGE